MNDTGPVKAEPLTNEGLRNVCFAHPLFKERYQGWEEVGHGAFATVVKTHCVDRGETVAVKVFHHLGDEDDRRRFQAEVTNSQRIVSPYLVRTYSPFDRAALRWIEMELVDGTDLEKELARRDAGSDPFPFSDALDIAIAVTSALSVAHRENVVHRDLKPANILLPHSKNPVAKLGDFGISRFAGAGKLTGTGAFPGTPKFGSPEAFAGEPLGTPHDVYSLGLCLYLLFTNNRFPFQIPEGCSLNTLISIHTKKAPYPARTFNPALPLSLDALLTRCLDKKAQRRPSAADVLDGLERTRQEAATPEKPRASRGWLPQSARLAVAGGAAVFLIGLGLALRSNRPRAPMEVAVSGTPERGVGAEPGAAPSLHATASGDGAVKTIKASIQGSFVEVQNGPETLKDIRLSLVGAGGRVFEVSIPGTLGANETTLVPLDSFTPPADREPGFSELRLRGTAASGRRTAAVPVR